MQAGWQTEEPFFSGSQCCVEKQQTPEEDRKGLEKRGSHPSAGERETPRVTVARVSYISVQKRQNQISSFLLHL